MPQAVPAAHAVHVLMRHKGSAPNDRSYSVVFPPPTKPGCDQIRGSLLGTGQVEGLWDVACRLKTEQILLTMGALMFCAGVAFVDYGRISFQKNFVAPAEARAQLCPSRSRSVAASEGMTECFSSKCLSNHTEHGRM